MSKILYLPIEIVERELDSKILLAYEALKRGYQVYLGDYWRLPAIAKSIGGGFYLYKAMTDYRAKELFKPLAESGVRSGVLDEEGLIFPSLDYYVRTRIGKGDSFAYLSKIFTWGRRQFNHLMGCFDLKSDQIVDTGNPRFDLLRIPYRSLYEERAYPLKKRYGDFVLVNTNFGPGNYSPHFKMSYHEHMRSFGRISNAREDHYYSERTSYYARLFDEYVEMVLALARAVFPKQVIVRPHPVEDHQRWREKVTSEPNVHVLFEGNALDWIAACKCVIHTGCTTGVEAFAMGKPVLRYNTSLRLDMESSLPNQLGQQFVELSTLLKEVSGWLNDERQWSCELEQINLLREWIANIDGDFSYRRIIDAIEDDQLAVVAKPFKVSWISMGNLRGLVRNGWSRTLAAMAKRMHFLQKSPYVERVLQRVQRFSGIKKRVVVDRVRAIGARFEQCKTFEIDVRMVAPDVFCLTRKVS